MGVRLQKLVVLFQQPLVPCAVNYHIIINIIKERVCDIRRVLCSMSLRNNAQPSAVKFVLVLMVDVQLVSRYFVFTELRMRFQALRH